MKREVADSLHEFADQEDSQLSTTQAPAYVQGIRDAANRITEK